MSTIRPSVSTAANSFNILLIGMTGRGKSSAGNKLIAAGEPDHDKYVRQCTSVCSGLLLYQDISETSGRSYYQFEEGGKLTESTTKMCQLLYNKLHGVYVLDVPGFADSAAKERGVFQANLAIFRSILRIQIDQKMPFHCIAYFLPGRGPLEIADGNLQEEIKVMYHFCGSKIFKKIVLIATNHKRRQKCGFTSEDTSDTREVFQLSFKLATGVSWPFGTNEPPIVYVSTEDDGETLRKRLKEAYATDPTGFYCKFVNTVCARCAITIIASDGKEVGVRTTKDGAFIDIDHSKCHPIFLPRYSTLEKISGGVAHITTAGIPYLLSELLQDQRLCPFPGFFNSDELCPACNKPPGTPGCTPIKAGPCTIEWRGKKETVLTIDHTNNVVETVTMH